MKKAAKVTTVGTFAAGSSGSVAGEPENSNRGETDLDVAVDFDPDSKEELAQFFEDIQGLSEKEHIEVHKILNKKQAKAVTKALNNLQIGGEVSARESSRNSLQSGGARPASSSVKQKTSEVASVWARHWCSGHKLWEFELKVEWDFTIRQQRYRSLVDVRPKPDPQIHDSTWKNAGEVTSWMYDQTDGDPLKWEVYERYSFEYIGAGLVPTVSYSPYIHMEGEATYSAEVDKSDNVSNNYCIVY